MFSFKGEKKWYTIFKVSISCLLLREIIFMDIIIANIITVIASLFLLYASSRKDRKQTLIFQIAFLFTVSVANIFLKTYTAIVVNMIGIVRNLLVLADKNKLSYNIILLVLSLVIGIIVNTNGLLGYLPIIANGEETIVILNQRSKVEHIKIAGAISCFLWTIFMFVCKNYTGAFFNLVTAITYISYLFKKNKI